MVLAGPLRGGTRLAWVLQPCLALCQLCSSAPRCPSAEPRAGSCLVWKDVRCLLEARCSLSDAIQEASASRVFGLDGVSPVPPSLRKHAA